MDYKLCDNPWNDQEINAIQKVIDSGFFTMGKYVKEFEEDFAKKVGSKYAIMVNSGSSANLLAIASLIYSNKLQRGDEVIVPAVSWSTTYAPLEQFGLKLIFVDIDKDTLNIDVDKFSQAITEKTKMLFAVNLLGNPNQFDEILKICNDKNIILLEDNCESLGGYYNNTALGTFGLIGTYSTFYSHHICTMEGGVCVTNDDILYEYMLSIRTHGWTRNLPDNSKIYTKKDDNFYESFNFIVPGFNLRPIEMEGAIGVEQLKKLDSLIENRRRNAEYFFEKMNKYSNIKLQKEVGKSSWFGFSLVLQDDLIGKRKNIVEHLSKNNIEVRPIVTGNFTRNPVIKYMNYDIPFDLCNADLIHDNGFFIGNHSNINNKQVDYFVEQLDDVLKTL